MKLFARSICVAALIIIAACNPLANLDGAETKIERFQNTYNSGDVDGLYDMMGETFREVFTREEFDELFALFDARLGPIVESTRDGFNVNTLNGFTTTVVTMQTRFEQGEGVETYTFHGHGEDVEIVGWHVNSPRLKLTIDDVRAINQIEQSAPTTAVEVEP